MAVYKDIGFDMVKESSEGVKSKLDANSINQSIKNIIFTNRGEVPFDPLFGSGIRSLLFEKMSPITEMLLKEEIRHALRNHEPRIVINNIELRSFQDTLTYELDIEYTILYLNTQGSVTVDIRLQGV
jgi:phage baseplate assembly protein W